MPRVGRRFRCTRLDLYEQCSDHITEKIPSSVSDGVRPISFSMRAYSSGVMLCSFSSAGVICAGVGSGGHGLRRIFEGRLGSLVGHGSPFDCRMGHGGSPGRHL